MVHALFKVKSHHFRKMSLELVKKDPESYFYFKRLFLSIEMLIYKENSKN